MTNPTRRRSKSPQLLKGYRGRPVQLDAKGEGSGILYGAAQIKFNKDNQLEVEHYGTTPIRLVNIRPH